MLQKVTYNLLCTGAGSLSGHAGSELHALLFQVIRSVDKSYADYLHALDLKPFALGPLKGSSTFKDGYLTTEKDRSYSFTLATLNQEMTEHLPAIEKCLQNDELRLGGSSFTLEETKKLFKKPLPYFKLMAANESKGDLYVSFNSPTCFRRDGKLHLFPLPELMLPGLVKRWEHFSGLILPTLKPEKILVSQYDLKTRMVKFSKYNMVGFKGRCMYSFISGTPDIDRWALAVLFNYASLASVGYKTTMGMGQVRVNIGR